MLDQLHYFLRIIVMMIAVRQTIPITEAISLDNLVKSGMIAILG